MEVRSIDCHRCFCDECQHDFLIAYSCKCRGVFPSCNTRRMAETAAHLVDHVFPPLPVRQWDNRWSLFVRLANPQARREAITSRPWLMSSVGRKTEHAGQTTITLTGLHAEFAKARTALTRVPALLQGWTIHAAEQFNPSTVWSLVCDHLKRVLAAIAPTQARRALENHALGAG